jgi:hypothetical protein
MYRKKSAVKKNHEYVADLSLKGDCRHSKRKGATFDEAVSIDVFATVREFNLPLDVIPCEDNIYGRITTSNIISYGLFLLF